MYLSGGSYSLSPLSTTSLQTEHDYEYTEMTYSSSTNTTTPPKIPRQHQTVSRNSIAIRVVGLGLVQHLHASKCKKKCFLATICQYLRHKTAEKEQDTAHLHQHTVASKSYPNTPIANIHNPLSLKKKSSHTSQQTPPTQHPPHSDAKSSGSARHPPQLSTSHQDY
jgi:hypothetical protein